MSSDDCPDYCTRCEGFGYYPLGRMNVHLCFACKGSGFPPEFLSWLPWDHPVIRIWVKQYRPDEPIPSVRKVMGLPRPIYVPEIHGPDALPRMYRRDKVKP